MAASALLAQDPAPDGFIEIDSLGKIRVFAPAKDTLQGKSRSVLLSGIRRMYDTYVAKYGLDKEVLRVGIDGGILADRKREAVGLYVFPDLAAYQQWVGDEGVAAHTQRVARYSSVVCIPLDHGAVGDQTWALLWHELSHVFYGHYLYLGRPMWLNEGLAEFFAYAPKHGDGSETELFRAMVAGLSERKASGAETPVAKLLVSDGDGFGRQQYDEAWVLVHLLMTEAPDLLDGLLGSLLTMDAAAWSGEEVFRDMDRYAAMLLTEAFEGEEKLQAAWNAHRDAILANPTKPKRTSIRVGTIKPSSFGVITARMSAAEANMRHAIGSARYEGPWPATLEVTLAVGDGKGAWSKEYSIVAKQQVQPGDSLKFSEIGMPEYLKEKVGRVTMQFRFEGGGVYRVRKVWNYK